MRSTFPSIITLTPLSFFLIFSLRAVSSFLISHYTVPLALRPSVSTLSPLTKSTESFPLSSSYDKIQDDDDEDDDDEEEDEETLSSSSPLGINIGSIMDPLTPEQAAELRAEARAEIQKAFQGRIDDIQDMKRQIQQDFEKVTKDSQEASNRRAQEETQRLLQKIDSLSQGFLNENQNERNELKLASRANQQMEGMGVELGSWGQIRGIDVVMKSDKTLLNAKEKGQLLGSVGSAIRSNNDSSKGPLERRILIVADENQDKGIQRILNKFTSLAAAAFDQGFDNTVLIDKFTPSSTIPMGGNNAQCVILASTTMNGRSSAENILSRVLKRTVLPGGAVGVPPSHIVVLSLLGSERTNVFPYSMQNMMGGKLSKCLEVEETVKGIVKGRLEDQVPLDYTIMKIGEVVDDSKAKTKLSLKPGDSLDGDIGVDAAATALLQALAYQPYARNSTFSVIGGIDSSMSVTDSTWDDWFLRLNGPEILRIDNIFPTMSNSPILNEKYLRLSEFVTQWSKMFENGAKGTGLTTPVMVKKSTLPARKNDSVLSRSGIVLEFKQTMTGSAYKSKGEERELERQTPMNKNAAKRVNTNMSSILKKEGGVEILVELTVNGSLRVRARRCNMDDSTVIKELSEETILGKLKDALQIFIKNNV